jgi:hypothetical protein
MKTTLLAVSILLCTAASPQKLTVYTANNKVGTAKFSHTLTASGGVKISVTIQMSAPGGQVTMAMGYEYDAAGNPLKESQTLSAKTGDGKTAMSQSSRATFSGSAATVVKSVNGKESRSTVKAPAGVSIADTSNFWFLKTRPRVGAKISYHTFDSESLKWTPSTTMYVGPVTITISGKTRKVHHIRSITNQRSQDVYVDDRGGLVKATFAGGLTLIAD